MSKIDYRNLMDEDLIKLVQAEDRRAFNELAIRYSDKLLNHINGYVHDYALAENLKQDTLLKVWTHSRSYREIAKFSTWTFTIAGNLAKTELRKIKRRKTFSFSQLSSKDNEFTLERIGGEENHSLSDDHQTYLTIREAISKLPEEFRNIIILKDIQELSYEEISKILDLPLGTVKSRINRARLKLKEIIKQDRRNNK